MRPSISCIRDGSAVTTCQTQRNDGGFHMRAAAGVRLAIMTIAPLLGLIAARAETAVERGAYLVTTIGACGNCHSPRDASGRIVPGTELSGGFSFDDAVGHVVGPNITPDRETGIGARSSPTTMRRRSRPTSARWRRFDTRSRGPSTRYRSRRPMVRR
jgi:hypothetical protein